MRERESSVPIIVQISESAKKYSQKGVLESPAFKQIVEKLSRQMDADNNPQVLEAIKSYVKQGISMIENRVGLLPAFSNPQSRKEVLEKFKKDKVEGAWVDIFANWDTSHDKYGVGVLRKCREKDMEEIMAKSKEAKSEQEKAQIKLQADAVGKGQDLIINYFKKQIDSTFIQKAA